MTIKNKMIIATMTFIVAISFFVISWGEAYNRQLEDAILTILLAISMLVFSLRMLYSVGFEDENFNSDL